MDKTRFKSAFRTAILLTMTLVVFAITYHSGQTYAATSTGETVIETTDDFYDFSNRLEYGIRPTSGNIVLSYLIPAGDSYMRVTAYDYEEKGITVTYYDQDFTFERWQRIPVELPLFGGFYESDSNFYIVTGQKNPKESDSVEVYRVTKYDKDWNRLGACGIYAANTYIPFRAGSCRMTMMNDVLFIYTCRTMYADSNGVHHQGSRGFAVDTSSMQDIRQAFTFSSSRSFSSVSHSFNQFILTDGNDLILSDHGDGHPRAITLNVQTYAFSDDGIPRRTARKESRAMEYPGAIGENATGASVGAIGYSDTHYLVAGAAVYRDGFDYSKIKNGTNNIFVSSVDRDSMAVSLTWITDYPDGKNIAAPPHMVKISEDRYMILWALDKTVNYTFIDGTGKQTDRIYSFKGYLSDCVPVVKDGSIIWNTAVSERDIFYSVSAADPDDVEIKTNLFVNRSKGSSFDVDGNSYYISSADSNTVSLFSAQNVKNCIIPAAVDIYGIEYKVTDVDMWPFRGGKIRSVTLGENIRKINVSAFNRSKASLLILKTRKLTSASVRGCLKGSKVSTVKVDLGDKKTNKKYVKKYKKIFTKNNAGRKVSVK